jgi:hypothetical protein
MGGATPGGYIRQNDNVRSDCSKGFGRDKTDSIKVLEVLICTNRYKKMFFVLLGFAEFICKNMHRVLLHKNTFLLQKTTYYMILIVRRI